MKKPARPYTRFLPEMLRRGFGRTQAYTLRAAGLIETFSIGRASFVYTDTLDALPEKLKDPANQERLKAARLGVAA